MSEYGSCQWCDEPIYEIDMNPIAAKLGVHSECAIRAIFGSTFHQLEQCHCYGGHLEEPEHMSKRQLALLASAVYHEKQKNTFN